MKIRIRNFEIGCWILWQVRYLHTFFPLHKSNMYLVIFSFFLLKTCFWQRAFIFFALNPTSVLHLCIHRTIKVLPSANHSFMLSNLKNFLICISFTSYEQPIWISNFCNEFLFTYFVSKYWQDKSFKLRPKYIKKCQYNSLHKKIKTLCNTLNWWNWNLEFVKLVVRWAEQDIGY